VEKIKGVIVVDESQQSVESKKKEPYNHRCFYFPLCNDGARSCHGWNQLKCVHFRPPNGNLPAGPHHHEWTEAAKEEKKRMYAKEAAERVKKCTAKKRQMQSATLVALNHEGAAGGAQGKLPEVAH
jgi:hypothetical protein